MSRDHERPGPESDPVPMNVCSVLSVWNYLWVIFESVPVIWTSRDLWYWKTTTHPLAEEVIKTRVCLIVCGLFPGGGVGNHTPPETQLARWVKALLGPQLRLLIQWVHDVTSCPGGGGEVCLEQEGYFKTGLETDVKLGFNWFLWPEVTERTFMLKHVFAGVCLLQVWVHELNTVCRNRIKLHISIIFQHSKVRFPPHQFKVLPITEPSTTRPPPAFCQSPPPSHTNTKSALSSNLLSIPPVHCCPHPLELSPHGQKVHRHRMLDVVQIVKRRWTLNTLQTP